MESLPIKTEKDGCGEGGQLFNKTQQNQGEGFILVFLQYGGVTVA